MQVQDQAQGSQLGSGLWDGIISACERKPGSVGFKA